MLISVDFKRSYYSILDTDDMIVEIVHYQDLYALRKSLTILGVGITTESFSLGFKLDCEAYNYKYSGSIIRYNMVLNSSSVLQDYIYQTSKQDKYHGHITIFFKLQERYRAKYSDILVYGDYVFWYDDFTVIYAKKKDVDTLDKEKVLRKIMLVPNYVPSDDVIVLEDRVDLDLTLDSKFPYRIYQLLVNKLIVLETTKLDIISDSQIYCNYLYFKSKDIDLLNDLYDVLVDECTIYCDIHTLARYAKTKTFYSETISFYPTTTTKDISIYDMIIKSFMYENEINTQDIKIMVDYNHALKTTINNFPDYIKKRYGLE
jgi:hypothetical protein